MRYYSLNITLFIVLFAFQDERQARGSNLPTIDAIRESWILKEKQMAKLAIEWVRKDFQPKGALNHMFPAPVLKDGRLNAHLVAPPVDLETSYKCSLRLDSQRAALSIRGKKWSMMDNSLAADDYDSVFDGTMMTSCSPNGVGKRYAHPSGWVRNEGRFIDARKLGVSPLFYHLRPVDPLFTPIPLSNWSVTNRWTQIDGKRCCEIEELNNANTVSRRYWIDPEANNLIRRIHGTNPDSQHRFALRYRIGHNGKWELSGWTSQILGPGGSLQHTAQVDITTWTDDVSAKDSDFAMKFPPGTVVQDDRAGTEYVLKMDGTQRVIQPGERTAKYEQLLRTGSGELVPGSPGAFLTLQRVLPSIV